MSLGKSPREESPAKRNWRRFKANKPAFASLLFLCSILLISLLGPFLATDQPWYVSINGQTYFPAFTQTNNLPVELRNPTVGWRNLNYESVVWAPLPYSPGAGDGANNYANAQHKGPFDKQLEYQQGPISLRHRHWLGTTWDGSDLLSGLIHGTRISLTVGLSAVALATLIGLILGALAGYLGDTRFRISLMQGLFFLPALLLAYFYGFQLRSFALLDSLADSFAAFLPQLLLSLLIASAVLFVYWKLSGWLSKKLTPQRSMVVPLDSIILKIIEIFNTIPRLILIVSIAALIGDYSLFYLILIIGITSWTGIARLTRAEFLRIRELDYMQSGRSLGLPEWQLIFRHALPNALPPISITIIFGVSSAILAESALSFIGVGVPAEVLTWGKLLSEGQEFYTAWWMVIFPGLALFFTLTALNLLGEGWQDALNPRHQRIVQESDSTQE